MATLNVREFRNLEPLSLELGGGAHLVLGDNGAGKTSLLEAVYLLATTRSFRTAQLADCCRHDGSGGFHLAGEVEGEARARLELGWTREASGHRAVNGNRTSLAEHLSVLRVVSWTSADTEILTGAPALRRKFLDRGIVGLRPASLDVLSRYRQTLAEKRQLLLRDASAAELTAWNVVLAQAAAELVARRAAYVELLSAALAELLAGARLDLPEITLVYRPSPAGAIAGATAGDTTAEGADVEAILDAFEAAAPGERRRQRVALGPHRDELEIRWQGHEIRRVASAGERKALGLALLAAHSRVLRRNGPPPIHLLDDVDTELDRGRLEALWELFGEAPQVFATSNRPWVWEDVEVARRWRCKDGKVETTGLGGGGSGRTPI